MNKKPKKLPKDTKFATFESGNEDDILMEIFIANLIHNGIAYEELISFTEDLKHKKDRAEMTNKLNNIILDFITLNPQYAEKLKRNNAVNEFLKSLGVNL